MTLHRLDLDALPELGPPRALPPRVGRPFPGGHATVGADAVRFTFDAGPAREVPGDVFAVAAAAPVAVVHDRAARRLSRVDLSPFSVTPLVTLEGQLERQVRPPLAVDAAGARALVLDGLADGQVALLEVDLDTGATRRAHGPLPARSWATGALAPGGRDLAVLEQRFEPAVAARLLRLAPRPRALATLPVAQPMHPPAFLGPRALAAVLTEAPFGLATYGPADLFLVSWPGGARRRLTDRGDLVGPPRVLDGALEVDVPEGRLAWALS